MQSPKKLRMRLAVATAVLATAALALAGCSSSGSSSSGGDSSRLLSVFSGNPGSLVDNFNPFVASVVEGANGGIVGSVYEPLFYYNTAKNEAPQPWLGKSFTVSPDGLTYNVTLQSGVKWQDGVAFSASDVAYTYNLIKDNPALNLYGLNIAGATATDATHVTIKLTKSNFPAENDLLGLTFIVPQHIWKNIKDPAKAVNAKPIGTGPFKFGSFSPQAYTVVKNTDYYQKGQPAIPGIRFVSSTGNAAALNSLNAGTIDWAGIALQDVQKSFVDKNPKYNHYTSIPADIKVLYLNLTKAPFNDVAFRQALSLSIDRTQIIADAFGGTDTPANPTSLLQPRDAAFTPAAYKGKTMETDLATAKADMAAAGYKLDSAGHLLGKDGQPITFNIATVTGYSDTITADQLLVQDFAKLGIQATAQQLSLGAYSTARADGTFDVLDDRLPTGPNPFAQFNANLNSSMSAPIGKPANGNFVRFSDPKIDSLLSTAASTNDPTVLAQTYGAIGTYFAQNQPYVILSQNGAVSTYRTQYFTGWPTASNLWADPSNWLPANIGYVAKSLKPVK